jgi:hypothetical protein
MEFELQLSNVLAYCLPALSRKGGVMRLPNIFTKEVLIRLHGEEAFAATARHGRFYSKTKEFRVCFEASLLRIPESASPVAKYLVPPLTMPPGQ